MTFTSYAQNFEDVMLWRALRHVSNGQYVDIGAQDPVVDSVSKAFYERGWRGIHVEPVPHYAALLRKDRPDEIVLEMAISDTAGLLELNIIEGTGLSTGVKAYAESHRSARGFEHRTVHVPMLPIRAALSSLEGQPVHWMKIDIEGLEEQALRGWDSQKLRPWIIVVEATVPLSSEPSHENIDKLLAAADYQFVYFDGLNRFYVAEEHQELVAAFAAPPNVFDDVELSGLSASWCNGVRREHLKLIQEAAKRFRDAEAALGDMNARLSAVNVALEESARADAMKLVSFAADLKAEIERSGMHAKESASRWELLERTERRVKEAEDRVHALEQSTSWRVTGPIRLLVSAVRGQLDTNTVDRMARTARRFGLYGPARAIYCRLKGAPSVPAGQQTVHHAARPNHIRTDEPQIAQLTTGMSSDARAIFDQMKLRANTNTKTGND